MSVTNAKRYRIIASPFRCSRPFKNNMFALAHTQTRTHKRCTCAYRDIYVYYIYTDIK